MASRRRGRPPKWAPGHPLVLFVKAYLEATPHPSPKAVEDAIDAFVKINPAYKTMNPATLLRKYYHAAALPAPPPTEEDRRVSILMQWGKATKRHPASMSEEQAREIVDRVITGAPPDRRDQLDQLFTDRSIHKSGRQKIKDLQSTIDEWRKNPHYWPIPFSRYGRPDVVAGKIEAYLANAPEQRAHLRDIVAGTGLRETTIHNTLGSMNRAGRIHHFGNGVYGLLTPGASYAPYVSGDEAVFGVLDTGGEWSPADLRAKTDKSEGAIAAALHRLHHARRIVRTKRGKYAKAGSAPPHVYARDAIIDKWPSGKKTMMMPELMTVSGKTYGATWQAMRLLEAKHRAKRIERRGQPLAWALR
jgi:hypothetical protein